MTRTLLLIGTDHGYQTGDARFAPAKHQAFSAYIRHTAAEREALAIAEESNVQALKELGLTQSVLEVLAKDLGLSHRYCDPDRDTRQHLGIKQENDIRIEGFPNVPSEERVQARVAASHRLREQYWLGQLVELDVWPCLFVCGANHAVEFSDLLTREGFTVELLCADWDA